MAKTQTRKPFEIEREIAALKAERHEAISAGTCTVADDDAMSSQIKTLQAELNAVYTAGANGENLFAMKIGPGKYEITDGTTIEVEDNATGEIVEIPRRARGETPEEMIANWNDGNYFLKPGGVGVTKN